MKDELAAAGSGNRQGRVRSGRSRSLSGARLRKDDERRSRASSTKTIHPAWREFVRYCTELGHVEIEQLEIQDDLPVLAEVTRKKVRFT